MVVAKAVKIRDFPFHILGEIDEVILSIPPEPLLQHDHPLNALAMTVLPEEEERIVDWENQGRRRVSVATATEVDLRVMVVDTLGQLAPVVVLIGEVLVVPFDPTFAEI